MSSSAIMHQTVETLTQTIQDMAAEIKELKETMQRFEGQIQKSKKAKEDAESKPKDNAKQELNAIKKPSVILPNLYCDGELVIYPGCCKAIQCNHQMFTQCLEPPSDGEEYCKKCHSGGLKYGTIDKRGVLDWTDVSGKKPRKPKPGKNLWNSMNISIEQAEKAKIEFLKQFGDDFVDAEFHINDLQKRERGRPKGTSASSSTESSPSQKPAPKKKGAPKKESPKMVIVNDTDEQNPFDNMDDEQNPFDNMDDEENPFDNMDDEENPFDNMVVNKSIVNKETEEPESSDSDNDNKNDVISAIAVASQEMNELENKDDDDDDVISDLDAFNCSEPEEDEEEEEEE
jgi:hypothetical protein